MRKIIVSDSGYPAQKSVSAGMPYSRSWNFPWEMSMYLEGKFSGLPNLLAISVAKYAPEMCPAAQIGNQHSCQSMRSIGLFLHGGGSALGYSVKFIPFFLYTGGGPG